MANTILTHILLQNTPSAPTINGLPDRVHTTIQPVVSATNVPANDVAAPGDVWFYYIIYSIAVSHVVEL